ncbi:MAG: hypothetical protein M1840_007054 [Geoglossum simile]|nr:MAG: hypothetical protein M1840_007054 [Geoglossum simile]
MGRGSGHSCTNSAGLSQPHSKQRQCEELSETREESVIDRLRSAEGEHRPQPSSRPERPPNQRGVALSSGSPNPPRREVPRNENESQLRTDCKSPAVQAAQDSQHSGRKLQPKESEEDQPLVDTSSPRPSQERGKKHSQIAEANKTPRGTISEIQLTREALKELDRRTTQPTFPSHPAPIDRVRLREKGYLGKLRKFAGHGGPDLLDLRGYRVPRPLADTMRKRDPKVWSPYDEEFSRELIENGIYLDRVGRTRKCVPPKPNNLEEINKRLTQPRPSLSPSRYTEEKFDTFADANMRAVTEDEEIFATMIGKSEIESGKKNLFTNLAPLNYGSFVKDSPDFYDGSDERDIDKRIKEELRFHIIPTKSYSLPCLPNFFAELKGLSGSSVVSRRQACYGGALGARAMQSLRSFGVEATYDNNAYTISATYQCDSVLKIYAHHPTHPVEPGGQPEYYMNQLGAFAMTGGAKQFRKGATALRNAREWAKEQRDNFIAVANDRARNMPAAPRAAELTENSALFPPATQTAYVGTASSAIDFALDPSRKRRRDARSSGGDDHRAYEQRYSTDVSTESPCRARKQRRKVTSGSSRGTVRGEPANERGVYEA